MPIYFLFLSEVSLTMQDIRNSHISYVHGGASTPVDTAIILALGQASEATSTITFNIEVEDNTKPLPSPQASFVINVEEGE